MSKILAYQNLINTLTQDLADTAKNFPEDLKKADDAVKALESAFNAYAKALATGIAGKYQLKEQVLQGAIDKAGAVITPSVTAAPTGTTGGALAGIGEAFATLSAALAPVAIVVGAVVGAFEDLASKSRSFVQALSPATIQLFDQMMQNLSATIGVAFLPVFQVFGSLAANVSGQLLPVMQQLAPIVQQLAQLMGDTLLSVIKVLANIFGLLTPVLQLLMVHLTVLADQFKVAMLPLTVIITILAGALNILYGILQPIIDLFFALEPVFSALIEVFNALVKVLVDSVVAVFKTVLAPIISAVGSVLKLFSDSLKGVILTMVAFVARFASLVFPNIVQNLIDALSNKPGALAAPTNSRIASFEQIAKDVTTASFVAGAGGVKETNDFLADILQALRDIQRDNNNRPGAIQTVANAAGIPTPAQATSITARVGASILRATGLFGNFGQQ